MPRLTFEEYLQSELDNCWPELDELPQYSSDSVTFCDERDENRTFFFDKIVNGCIIRQGGTLENIGAPDYATAFKWTNAAIKYALQHRHVWLRLRPQVKIYGDEYLIKMRIAYTNEDLDGWVLEEGDRRYGSIIL
jgi:hypothetical protein